MSESSVQIVEWLDCRCSWSLHVDDRITHLWSFVNSTEWKDIVSHDWVAESWEWFELQCPRMHLRTLPTKSNWTQIGWHKVCKLDYVLNPVLEVLLKLLWSHLVCFVLLLCDLELLLIDLCQWKLLLLVFYLSMFVLLCLCLLGWLRFVWALLLKLHDWFVVVLAEDDESFAKWDVVLRVQIDESSLR